MAVVLESPAIDEAGDALREALSKRQFIVIIGKCTAEYRGRSSSKLGAGERALIIKRDGAAFLHRPLRCEPVNWQPPGSSLRSKVSSEDRLEISITRKKPRETLEISFEEIHLLATMHLVDSGRFSMVATEEDIQQALLARPELIEEGFTPLSRETNLGDAGFLDVLGEDKKGNLVVVEIKRISVGNDAAFQLKRYIEALKGRTKRPLRGIIAAPQLRRGTFATIQALGLEFRRISLAECAEIIATAKDSDITDFFGE